ncbi:MAG: alpha/beta hydrolase [Planctomycetota bacterium]|nr:alpha/beta hydrolase [Planctomycetota bacterium]
MRWTSLGCRLFVVAVFFASAAMLDAQDRSKIPDGIDYQADVEYGMGGEVPLHLDLARPKEAKGKLPCIVTIHGGAWHGGDKKGLTPLVLMMAQRGYVAVTVQYRFCPQHVFPAQVEDVKCAVRYLRAHAEEYSIDPERIGAVGFSAGAHLSMMLGTMQIEDGLEGEGGWGDQSSGVQGVVAYFGPTDLAADDLPDVSKGLVKDFLGGTKSEVPEQYRLASPLTYVNKGDAPLLILQGTKDPLVPHTQAIIMVDALTAAEVPGRVELILGAGHGWGPPDQQRTIEETFAFFDQHLKE